MSADFTERMKAAEAAMLERRNRARASVRGSTPVPDGSATHVPSPPSGLDMLAIEALITAADRKIRHDLNEVIENALHTVRKHEVRVTINGEQVGKVLDGVTHRQLDDLIRSASVVDKYGYRKNIMLKGPMGGGKSTAARQTAEALGLSFGYIGQTEMPHDVVGYVHPVTNEYKSTPFVNAYINGGVVVLEEMDSWSPRATLVLNVPLANSYITLPNGEMHKRHPDCVVIACTNTWGTGATAEYVGRNRLDAAFLDRFAIKLDWAYDDRLERMAAQNDEVVEAVQRARYNATHYGIKVAISPRSSIDIADMVRCGWTIRKAMDANFLAGCEHDTVRKLLEDVDV